MAEKVHRAHHAVLVAQQAAQEMLLAEAEAAATPAGGALPTMSTGEPAVVHELHMAHAADGDLRVAYGPSARFATGRARPRLPRGDLLMLSRSSNGIGEVPDYRVGTVVDTEFDVPADPWFCRLDGSGGVPNVFLLESSLQAAAYTGVVTGLYLEHPDEAFMVRNLEGHAELVRDADPRGRTLRQRTTLLSHASLPGAIIQRYGYAVELDGELFYTGETSHGYFTAAMLAQQQGLDAGRRVPTWLETQGSRIGVRRLSLRTDERLGLGRLTLLDDVDLVPDGGVHGLGYVLCRRPVRSDDPLFDLHFRDDPVMPGSFGVETLHRAVRAFALYTGATHGITAPRFAPAFGTRQHWTYRGQILQHHDEVQAEVHIREVRRAGDRLLLRADGSVWRDGLRIYQVTDIAIEARTGDGKAKR
ncbi:hypothetical protein [Streptomyces sp. BP-8]|uniref:3-hydroxyacyl-[acyl-carrier-protein] dehydratase FabA n=1 Tax=Streptomyces sirii TaxID=3127701 RepID=A0ABZ2QEW8_9ACTN